MLGLWSENQLKYSVYLRLLNTYPILLGVSEEMFYTNTK